MSREDRIRWDARYAGRGRQDRAVGLAAVFRPFDDVFPTAGHALDLACGVGAAGIWLARRGMTVAGYDVSPIAVADAGAAALVDGVAGRCRFEVADLDEGLPSGPPANVVVCQRFRAPSLDAAIMARLAPGAVLAVSALSEVGGRPGPFRTASGELRRAFGGLDVLADGEGQGVAWLLARRRSPSS